MGRIAVIASASGNGKTTLGHEVRPATRRPFVELDAPYPVVRLTTPADV